LALGTLFTHGKYINIISPDNWRAILGGITSNVAPFDPIPVTLDYACQYVRAVKTSTIVSSEFNQETGIVTINLEGTADLATKIFVFYDDGGVIQELLVDVPIFNGTIEIDQVIP